MLKYIHRSLRDGELYYFFNESGETVMRTATAGNRRRANEPTAADGPDAHLPPPHPRQCSLVSSGRCDSWCA